MSFPFACPECKTSWPLSKKDIDTISKRLPLVCRECGNKFDIMDGLTEIITEDNIFLQYMLRSNHVLMGRSEISPGQVKVVDLNNVFSEIHEIFLTATGAQPIYCEPKIVSNSQFLILSSGLRGRSYAKEIQVMWSVYGNKRGLETPLWRQLLANAKGYEIDENFRMEIVELETAFEVFLTEYLKPKLREICSDEVVELLFKHFKRMEDVTKRLFKVATGNMLDKMLQNANMGHLYGKWMKYVKERRDGILHKGEKVKKDIAKRAFETVFKIIVFLQPQSLEYLYTSLEEYENIRGR